MAFKLRRPTLVRFTRPSFRGYIIKLLLAAVFLSIVYVFWAASKPPAPGHCILDELGPQLSELEKLDPQHQQQQRRTWEKFLIYQPQMGYNNQVQAVESALAYADVLNRTLVVPHLRARNGKGEFIDMDRMFDVARIRRSRWTRVITMRDFEELIKVGIAAPPVRLARVNGTTKYLHPNDDYFTTRGWLPDVRIRLPSFLGNDRNVRATFGGCKDQVLAFDTLFAAFTGYTKPKRDKKFRTLLRDLWVLQPPLRRIVSAAQASMGGSYACAHIRGTDFKEYCEYLAAEKERGSTVHWLKYFTLDACSPSTNKAAQDIVRHIRRSSPSVKRVYIATDVEAIWQNPVEHLKLPYKIFSRKLFHSVVHEIAGNVHQTSFVDYDAIDDFLPFIEQRLCVKAATFIGNRFSTFTRKILVARNKKTDTVYGEVPAKGAKPKRKQ